MSRKKPNLSATLKNKVAHFLMENLKDGKPTRGKFKDVVTLFNISRRSVLSIWSATKKKKHEGQVVVFDPNIRSKHMDRFQLDIEKFKSIPVKKRSTYRTIAVELGVSKSLVGLWFKQGLIKAHKNAIKLALTAQNKILRIQCLTQLCYDRALNIIKFKGMHNIVHIDEKWFYITKENERYYLLPGEIEPYRACKSKRFITKLMFMSAVSRPMYASNGDLIFDGKIGIFPFTKQEPAKRSSKNRPNGTLETKPIEAINKEVIKDCLINQILLAIKSKWPSNASKDIIIQQDNATPHISNNDSMFRAAANSDGFNINLVCQPANSPDTNINDLGFFKAIQSLQEKTASYTTEDLLKNVIIAYDELTHITLNNIFLSLQAGMIEIMKAKGSNAFKQPHMNKERLIREGRLPDCLQVEEMLVRDCIDHIRQPENEVVSTYDVNSLTQQLMWFG